VHGDDGIRRTEEEHAAATPLVDFFAEDLVPRERVLGERVLGERVLGERVLGERVHSVAVEADERLTSG